MRSSVLALATDLGLGLAPGELGGEKRENEGRREVPEGARQQRHEAAAEVGREALHPVPLCHLRGLQRPQHDDCMLPCVRTKNVTSRGPDFSSIMTSGKELPV